MSVHKLNTERAAQQPSMSIGLTFQHETYDLADSVLKTRAIRAIESAPAAYPIYRIVRCAARRNVEDVFDDLALEMGLTALRLHEGSLLLEGPGVFIQAEGRLKPGYTSCWFSIWTTSKERVLELQEQIYRIVGECYERQQMFTIDWHFMNGRGALESTTFDELVMDDIHDEAYPTLGKPVADFVGEYLESPATVLILQGPPGTGKTRLVRAILGTISQRRGEAKIMYTADKKALEGDEIFVEFITGSHQAFVIEDADHLLLARSNGNQELHRFLAIGDGVVRAQGRKIIFTTNLPNVNDIDEALVRPGRCFGSVTTRALTLDEAAALLRRLSADGEQTALAALRQRGAKTLTVAQLYQMLREESSAALIQGC
jgi:hypothetical protein